MKSSKYCLWGLLILAVLYPTISHALYVRDGNKAQPSYHPTQLIVRFRSAVNRGEEGQQGSTLSVDMVRLNALRERYQVAGQTALLSKVAIRTENNPLRNVYLLAVEEGTDLEAMARDYEQLDIVEYVHPDYQVELYGTPNDPLYPHQWALNNTGQGYYHVVRRDGSYNDTLVIAYGTPDADIDAEEVFQNPPDNTTIVVVAIVDTGIDWDHPDLAAMIWTNPGEIASNGVDDDHNGYVDDIVGWDFSANDENAIPIYEDNDPTDHMGHGTHCAGIVAAVINNTTGVSGVVPDAKIMALKFYPLMTLSMAAQAIVYAADNGADVINMSWGLGWPMPLVEDALVYAASRGVVLVAAAGNDGEEVTNFPAGYPQSIAVAATNSLDQVTDFSTFGEIIDISAPGQSILSLRADSTDMYAGHHEPDVHIIDGNYYLASGTSMSAPYTVAVAAYLRAVSPGLTSGATQEILQTTADDIVDPGWDMFSGHGRVNVTAALQSAPQVRAFIETPQKSEIVSGTVAITGSADGNDFTDYILEYGTGDSPANWTEITSSSFPVTNGLLGSWNTSELEGSYTLRLRVGDENLATVRIFVAAGAVAQITSPAENDTLSGVVAVNGTSLCPGLTYSVVEYGVGSSPSSWNLVDTITMPIYNGELAKWSTTSLDDGTYSLRLSLYSIGGLEVSHTITIFVQSVFSGAHGWTTDLGERLAWTANYCDLDHDGDNEIIIGGENGMHVLNTDGTIQTSGVPSFPPDDYRISVAVGTLDADTLDDLVAIGGSGVLYGFPSQADAFQVVLAEMPDMGWFLPTYEDCSPKVFLKDINNDGIDEIHYFPGGFDDRFGWHYIYNADGSPWGCGFPPPDSYERCLPADLDGDGIDEIYCYGLDLAQLDTCGNVVTAVPIEMDGLYLELVGMNMSAVDIDSDGRSELIVHGKYSISEPYENLNYWIYAYDEGLNLKDGWPHDMGISGNLRPVHPVFGDLDNDGTLEYATAYYDYSNGYIHVWHLDGSPFLGDSSSLGFFAASADPSIFTIPVVADANNDGTNDILVAAVMDLFLSYPVERIVGYAPTGDLLEGYPLVVETEATQLCNSIPVVGDINQDGYLDLVYPSGNGAVAFANFPRYSCRPNLVPCPMWRYNRRLNATAEVLASCCVGDRGNILLVPNCDQGDETVDITDITNLIDHLFINFTLYCCPEEADIAPAISGEPQDAIVDISDLTAMIDHLFINYPPLPACP